MTKEELKEIEDRCNKATPGPWKTLPPDSVNPCWYVTRRQGEEEGFYIACFFNGKEDAEFVINSREDIPKLMSYIKDLESQILNRSLEKKKVPENSGKRLCWSITSDETTYK